MTAITHSETETSAVGRELARSLTSGTVVLLRGDLGAGKTAFVRGIAEGLGIDPADVSSPTFTLIQEYRGGRLPLHHVDLYRLASVEVPDLGLDDLIDEAGVTAIEWPDRWKNPPPAAIHVHLQASISADVSSDAARTITIDDTRTDSSRSPASLPRGPLDPLPDTPE